MAWFPFDPQHFAQDYATFAGLTSAFVAEYEYQARRENEFLRLENERLRLENERLGSNHTR
jgi:hypothetical protein